MALSNSRAVRVVLLCAAASAFLTTVDAFIGQDTAGTYFARDTPDGGPVNLFTTFSPGSGWTCNLMSGDDSASANIFTPTFQFPFYGTPQTTAYMGTNGYVTFGASSTDYSPDSIPTTATPNNAIYGHWEDLYVDNSPDRACTKTTGSGGNEVAYAMWENVEHLGGGNPVNFVVVMWEEDGVIEVHYGNDLSDGTGAETAGIENAAGNQGVLYGYADPLPTSNKAIQYRPAGVAPQAIDDAYTLDATTFGGAIIVDGVPHGAQPAMQVLVANDQAVHNVPLTAAVLVVPVTPPTGGSLTQASGGVCSVTPGISADGSFCFTGTECGTYTFQYRVDDAFGTSGAPTVPVLATVTVDVINLPACPAMPPVARDDPEGAVAGTPASHYQAAEDTALDIYATAPGSVSPTSSCTATMGLLCNDDDTDGAAATAGLQVSLASVDTTALDGTLSDVDAANTQAMGAFHFVPTADSCGPTSFLYKAIGSDGVLSTAFATAYLNVVCAHDAPIANNDTYLVAEGATLTVAGTQCGAEPDLMCNDEDVDTNDADASATAGLQDTAGPQDLVIVCTQPPHGTVTVASPTTGGFTYTPSAGTDQDWNGLQSFTYKLRDGRTDIVVESACATVTLNVTALPDAPVAVADDYPLVPNSGWTGFAAPGLLANDADPDNIAPTAPNQDLTVVLSPAPVLSCPGGTGASITDLAADGSFTFLPPTFPANYVGDCTLTYRVEDASGALSAFVDSVIHVIDPSALFAANDLCAATEDTVVSAPSAGCPLVGLNDDVYSGPAPTHQLVSAPAPSQGTLSFSSSGAFTFTPVANFNGIATFTYRIQQVNPGTGLPVLSNTATVRIVVAPVADAPQATAKAYSLSEDCSPAPAAACAAPYFVVPATCGGPVQGLLCEAPGYDADPYDTPDDAPIAVAAQALPIETTHGKVTALGADGAFTYVPNPHANGLDTFTFQVLDAGATNNLSGAVTVTLNISAVADNPVGLPDPCAPVYIDPDAAYLPSCGTPTLYAAYYGHPLMVPAWQGLLANDYRPDQYPAALLPGTGLTASCSGLCTLSPAVGTLSVAADGSFGYVPPASGTCTDVVFTYRPQDPSGALGMPTPATLHVCPNLLPIASFTLSADTIEQGASIAFYDSSGDPDGAIVAWQWQFGDGQSSGIPDPLHIYEEPGVYSVTLTVVDNIGDVDTYTAVVTVYYHPNPAGSAPVARDISARAGADVVAAAGTQVRLAGSAVGTSSPGFQWSQVSGPTVSLSGADTANPTFVAPSVAASSDVRLRLVVVDGSRESAPDEVVIRVTPANRAPSAAVSGPPQAAVGETVSLDAQASQDPDGDTLQFGWTQVAGPRVALQGEAGAGIQSFVVPEGAAGQSIRMRVVASDGRLSAASEVTILVRDGEPEQALFRVGVIGSDGRATFDALVAGTTVWDFGDGSSVAAGPSIAHTYAAGGTYLVTVQIKEAGGDVRTYTKSVEVPAVALAAQETEPVEVVEHASSLGWVFFVAGLAIVILAGGAWLVFRRNTAK